MATIMPQLCKTGVKKIADMFSPTSGDDAKGTHTRFSNNTSGEETSPKRQKTDNSGNSQGSDSCRCLSAEEKDTIRAGIDVYEGDDYVELCANLVSRVETSTPIFEAVNKDSPISEEIIAAAVQEAKDLCDLRSDIEYDQIQMSGQLKDILKDEKQSIINEAQKNARLYVARKEAEAAKTVNTMRASISFGAGGTSNVSSPFPLPQEIVAMSKKLGSDNLSELVLDHLMVGDAPTLPEVVNALKALTDCYTWAEEQINSSRQEICESLRIDPSNIPLRVQTIIGHLQRESWTGITPTPTHQECHNHFEENSADPLLLLVLKSEAGSKCIFQFILKGFQWMTAKCLSDPPLQFATTIGDEIKFEKTGFEPLDGTCKPDELCVVLWPALVVDGVHESKSIVLPKAYEIN